jgi:lambda family phage portal protein
MAAKTNWIDRAFISIAPGFAERRLAARNRMAAASRVRALYDAASISRRTQGWRSVGTDANAEGKVAIGRLRDVAREMVRNNPFAARTKMLIPHNVVGTGILPQVRADRPERVAQVKTLIDRHFDSTDIDADGMLNLYGIQQLIMGTVVEAGECLIRKRPRRAEDGYALPFQLQVLEPDFIDSSIDGKLSNGNYAVQGVEFDLRGKRVAYYLFDQHPGSMMTGSFGSYRGQRVSADFIAHVYRVDRPGQVRGISWFAPVIVRMRDFADYTDAQLLRQKIAACFTAFISSKDDTPGATNDDGSPIQTTPSGFEIEQMEPGLIMRGAEGESVSFATPPTTSDFGPYASVTLHEISAGLGVSHESFTGDWTGVNYSSGRLGRMDFDRSIEAWQWNMLIPQFHGPLQRWTQEYAAVVTASTEPFTFGWTPPRRVMIDPDTEIKASQALVRAGFGSRSGEIRRLGDDPREVEAQIKLDNDLATAEGFVFDSDPRLTTNRGVAQKGADPNAPDDEPPARG